MLNLPSNRRAMKMPAKTPTIVRNVTRRDGQYIAPDEASQAQKDIVHLVNRQEQGLAHLKEQLLLLDNGDLDHDPEPNRVRVKKYFSQEVRGLIHQASYDADSEHLLLEQPRQFGANRMWTALEEKDGELSARTSQEIPGVVPGLQSEIRKEADGQGFRIEAEYERHWMFHGLSNLDFQEMAQRAPDHLGLNKKKLIKGLRNSPNYSGSAVRRHFSDRGLEALEASIRTQRTGLPASIVTCMGGFTLALTPLGPVVGLGAAALGLASMIGRTEYLKARGVEYLDLAADVTKLSDWIKEDAADLPTSFWRNLP